MTTRPVCTGTTAAACRWPYSQGAREGAASRMIRRSGDRPHGATFTVRGEWLSPWNRHATGIQGHAGVVEQIALSCQTSSDPGRRSAARSTNLIPLNLPYRKDPTHAQALAYHSGTHTCGSCSARRRTIVGPDEITGSDGDRTWDRSAGGSLELNRESSTGQPPRLTLRATRIRGIIPGEVIRERGDMTAQDAVTRATGITAAGTPGDGSSALASRGFVGHSSVMQLYDGTRL